MSHLSKKFLGPNDLYNLNNKHDTLAPHLADFGIWVPHSNSYDL